MMRLAGTSRKKATEGKANEEKVKNEKVNGEKANEEKVNKAKSAGDSPVEGADGADSRGGENEEDSFENACAADEPESAEPNPAESDPAAAVQKELAAERDKYLRLAAEYDNYRKRSAKEREMMYGEARADVILRLLPIYDNLERALKTECADEAFYKGVEMTMTQMTEIFESIGVMPIPAAGETFDPNRHNAVMTIEDPELGEKIVAEECQRGFMLGERIIRFSTVVVAN
jgi:molecular chaperone GrpE